MRPLSVLIALILLTGSAGPVLAQARIDDAQARAFVARQQQAWNAGRFDRFFAGFTADATFTDQAYVGDKPPVPYGTSTLEEAKTQVRQAAARGPTLEAVEVRRVRIAPDGQSAEVLARVGSRVTADGRARRLCASRLQTLVLQDGHLKSRGQTDTFVKCNR